MKKGLLGKKEDYTVDDITGQREMGVGVTKSVTRKERLCPKRFTGEQRWEPN